MLPMECATLLTSTRVFPRCVEEAQAVHCSEAGAGAWLGARGAEFAGRDLPALTLVDKTGSD